MPTKTLDAQPSTAGVASPPPPAGERFQPGTLVNDRYRVLAAIGAGGMGVVYRVEDQLHPECPLALKTLAAGPVRGERSAFIKAEFRIMAGLRHPNVAAVHDFERIQGGEDHFFTMEYVDGRDLLAATEGDALERILELVVQLLRALAYLHSRKIIHSDLKPGNLLVDTAGRLRVLDFGLAGVQQGQAKKGTPAYMAPEVFGGDIAIDHRADLYSAGVILYQLVYRRVPFRADSLASLRDLHAAAPIDFAPAERCPPWLAQVIARLCAKEPSARYRSANAVIADLNRLGGTAHALETAETSESYIVSSRFVGRDAELGLVLDFIWRRTRDGAESAPALCVGGVAGSGKSRLIREARQRVQLARMPFVESACYEGAFGELAPALEALRHVVRLARAAGAADVVEEHREALRRADPTLVDAGPAAAARSEAEAAERRALLDRLAGFLVAVAERVPYVLHIDDLQWAGAATIDLLIALVRRLTQARAAGRREPLAFIGSYRIDEAAGRPLARLLTEGLAALELGPLERPDVRILLCSMLGIDELPEAFVERVARETGGNAFFVEEVMRSLVDRGDVHIEGDAWTAAPVIGELAIPPTVAGVFRRRAGLLEPPLRALLERMAVLSRPAGVELLSWLADRSLEDTHLALRELGERRMVARAAGSAFAIGHDRMREAIYGDLAPGDATRLHLTVAETLEARLGAAADVNELAHHFRRAGDPRALGASLVAGDKAREAYANELAHEHLAYALVRLDAGDPRGAAVREKLADLEVLMGRLTDARPRYDALLAGEREPFARARLLRKIGALHVHACEFAAAVAPLRGAVELLGGRAPASRPRETAALAAALAGHLVQRIVAPAEAPREQDRTRCRELSAAHRQLANAYFYTDPPRMLLPMVAACNAAARGGESKELSRALAEVGYLYAYLGMHDSARVFGDRAVAMAQRLSSPVELGAALALRGYAWLMVGRMDEALPAGRRALPLLIAHGDVYMLAVAELVTGLSLLFTGQPRAAAESATGLDQMIRRAGAPHKYLVANLGLYLGMLGDRTRAEALLESSRAELASAGDPVGELLALALRGHTELVHGDAAAAVDSLEAARALARKTPTKTVVLGLCLPSLALARLQLARAGGGRPRRQAAAARVVAEGLSYTRSRPLFRAWALLADAAWSWHTGHRRHARRRFDACLALAEAQGNVWVRAEAHHELGRALLESGDAAAEGRRLLRQAADAFERMEMAPGLAAVRRLLGE